MFVLRFVVAIVALFLVGLLLAYVATRNRRYLKIASLTIQLVLLLVVGFMLLYLFERVFLLI